MDEITLAYRNLADAILEQAIEDAKAGSLEGESWLHSEGAQFMMDSMGIHPDTLKMLYIQLAVDRERKRENRTIHYARENQVSMM